MSEEVSLLLFVREYNELNSCVLIPAPQNTRYVVGGAATVASLQEHMGHPVLKHTQYFYRTAELILFVKSNKASKSKGFHTANTTSSSSSTESR